MEKVVVLHAYVSGLVQGVCFRFYTRERAQQLGLKGWVRNRTDGRVETLAIGEESNIKNFLEWLHRGPSSARVESVEYEIIDEPDKEYYGFNVEPTV